MLSIDNIKEYYNEYKDYKTRIFKSNDDTFDLYLGMIKTIFIMPMCLLLDVVLLPFYIGYLIFKKIVK